MPSFLEKKLQTELFFSITQLFYALIQSDLTLANRGYV